MTILVRLTAPIRAQHKDGETTALPTGEEILLTELFTDSYCGYSFGLGAEIIAKKEDIDGNSQKIGELVRYT